MDWFTRKVLVWRISNTLEADFCIEALNEAVHKFGPPEIMNTDQGSQFTSFAWTDRLWQRAVPRQHLRRAAMAHAQIRVCLPTRLGDRITGASWHSQMDGVLQQDKTVFCPWRQAACRGLQAGNQAKPNRSAGAENSLIYAENCPTIGE